MPQGRRKVPFSGKQKKQQIVAKRQAKSEVDDNQLEIQILLNCLDILEFFPLGNASYNSDSEAEREAGDANGEEVQKINYQSSLRSGRGTSNRYALQFYKESDERLHQMRQDALKPLEFVDKINLEIGTDDFTGYNFPKRPDWSYAMSKEQLDRNENSFFTVRSRSPSPLTLLTLIDL